MSTTFKESLTLEESNKIRVSLGLKPISTDAPVEKDADTIAAENYANRREQEAKQRDTAALQSRIDRSLNARERARQLVGVGLGVDENERVKQESGLAEGDDTKAWVKKQKKNAKIQAAKREKEQAEADKRDQEAGLAKYGEEDLRGIKVAHGQDDFDEGEETILTLKDSRVLDDEDDELHNLNISENTKTAEALELRRKGKTAGTYTGLDDDEFADGAVPGGAASVLKKYDEEIEGKGETGFRLGGPIVARSNGKGKQKEQLVETEERERVKLTMDYSKSFETDYLQEGDVGFKKPKTKKKRPTRVAAAKSDDEMEVDPTTSTSGKAAAPVVPRRTNLDETNLVDDDDLQASLARSRREAAKKRSVAMKSAMPVDVVQIKEESDEEDSGIGGVGFTIDDMSEFVQRIGRNDPTQTAVKREPALTPATNGAASVLKEVKLEQPDDVPAMEVVAGGWGPAREDGEESDEDTEMGKFEDGEPEDIKSTVKSGNADMIIGTAGQGLVSSGMASTLNLLRQQGLMQVRSEEDLQQDKERKQKAAWLAAKAERERERAEEALKRKGDNRTQAEREYDNRMRDQVEARETMEAFNSYKPVVDIKYHDEHGRSLNVKEAWKHLSHSFHGKGSGRLNTEKHLRKVADEKRREAMAAGDTALVMATAFAQRAERMGSATMILSTGNKGAAPIGLDPLLANKSKALSLSKGKGKAKVAKPGSTAPATVFSDIPMRSLPLPASTASESGSASPAVRAGFAPVQSFSPAPTSASTDAGKFIIPVSVKRKPTGEAAGAAAAKKR